jgi:hypothetical protein
VNVEIAKQEGSWTPWWHSYRVELVGWSPRTKRASVNGKNVLINQAEGSWGVTIPASAEGTHLTLQ